MKSLKARLGIELVIALIVVFALQWALVSYFIKYVTETYITSRIEHDIDVLLANIVINEQGNITLAREPEGRYSEGPFTGHYYVIRANNEILRSRSLWDQSLDINTVGVGATSLQRLRGPLEQPLLMVTKGFNKLYTDINVTVAEDITTLNSGIKTMQSAYLLLSSCLLLLLLLSQQWIVHRALKSLTTTRLNLERVSRGDTDNLSEAVPDEVLPLVQEINLLLELLSRRLQKTRTAVGNLAHSLKTPLSLLKNIKDDPAIKNETELLTTLDKQIESIQVTLERELNRARLAGDAKSGQRFLPGKELPALVETLEQIYKEQNLEIVLVNQQQTSWNADREDMLELFGNLADNACKWAKSTVTITLGTQPGQFTIEDDGPGFPADQIELLSQRGQRLDESIQGHGLGLSIVHDIVQFYKGTIEFEPSAEIGGLLVKVKLFNNQE